MRAGHGLATHRSRHQAESEDRLQRVEERIETYQADTSIDIGSVGQAGGIGMLVFAESEPRTPADIAAHAFAYAHLEAATYTELCRTAEATGDEATAATAQQIAEEEQQMAERVESCFDSALASSAPEPVGDQLDRRLACAHAIEKQGLRLLQAGTALVEDAELERSFGEHLRESEEHAQMVHERMQAREAAPLEGEDALLQIGSHQVGAAFAAQPGTETRLTSFAYAYEQLEIAAYELLARAAVRAGDAKALRLAERILVEERAAASRFAPAGPG